MTAAGGQLVDCTRHREPWRQPQLRRTSGIGGVNPTMGSEGRQSQVPAYAGGRAGA